jgi:16S rRNA C967 or C1407 C5-methylase (RsmB/RsmF family)
VKIIDQPFERGEEVSIYLFQKENQNNPNYYSNPHIHVANGEAYIPSSDFPKFKNGTIIKNTHPKYDLYPFHQSDLFQQGHITDQNLPPIIAVSILVDQILNSKIESEKLSIVDLCAAPGHKTTCMEEILEYELKSKQRQLNYEITAIDRSQRRLISLQQDILRLGLNHIQIIEGKMEKILIQSPQLTAKADFVLFDPPCSALGTRPKLFIDKSEKELQDYSNNQCRLLRIADQFVKPQGILMYNTCTIPKEENEEIVRYAVNRLNYKILPIPSQFSMLAFPGIPIENLEKNDTQKLMRFYPNRQEGCGYFIALLQKV